MTREVRDITRSLFDAAYWAATKARLRKGELHASVEVRLLAYAYGEPSKHVTVDGAVSVEDKRSVLAQIPADVLLGIMAEEAFEDADDGAVN